MNFVGLKSILYELKLIASKTSTFPHSLFKGPRGCFIAGTKVTLADYSCKNIEDLVIGDQLLGFDDKLPSGATRRLKPTTITNILKREVKDLVYIKSDKHEVWTTPEHPFLVRRSGTNAWKLAKTIWAQNNLHNFETYERTLEWRRGWVLGVLLADGTFNGKPTNKGLHKHFGVHFYNKNKMLIDKYIELLQDDWGFRPTVITKEQNKYQVSLTSRPLCSFLQKSVTLLMKNSTLVNKDFLRGVIGGLYDGDGTCEQTRSPEIINTSEPILNLSRNIIQILGFTSYTKLKQPAKIRDCFGKVRKVKAVYSLEIHNKSQFFGTFLPFTKIRYGQFYNTTMQQVLIKKRFNSQHGFSQKRTVVYNLTTTTNTYIANGFPVHNCGKTVLSREIGRITHQRFIELNAPALDKKRLYVVLLNTKPNDIIFIDEIHRLTPVVEEILYQPMESKMLTIPCGGRLMTVPFVPFTLIGATTRPALITKPLLSRFKITIDIPPYTTRDLARIIKGKYQMTNREALNIARHTLVPREALNLAERTLALDMGVATGLTFLNFKDGLSADERVYLKQLAQGDSHSIQSIASGMQLELDSITFLEDRLFKLGYIEVTSKGRQLTYLGLAKARSL